MGAERGWVYRSFAYGRVGAGHGLSSPETSRLVHKLRSEVAAIMVGTRTALLDNPSLNVRHWSGNSPVRVVLDRRLVIPDSYRLLNGFSRTLIFTEKEVENRENMEYIRIDFEGPVIRQVLDHLAAPEVGFPYWWKVGPS